MGKSLWVELASHCNLSCSFCYNDWRSDPVQSFPDQRSANVVQKDLIRLINRGPWDYVALSGGEPLLHRELDEIVEFLAASNIRSVLTTNGKALTRRRLESLAACGLQALQVPLLAGSPLIHDEIAGGKSWRLAITAMALGVEYGLSVSSTFVMTSQNATEISEVLRTLHSIGVSHLVVNQVQDAGSAAKDMEKLAVPLKDRLKIIQLAKNEAEQLGINMVFSGHEWFSLEGDAGTMLDRAWRRLVLSVTGELKLCNLSVATLGPLSSLTDSQLDDLVTSLADGGFQNDNLPVDHCSCMLAYTGHS